MNHSRLQNVPPTDFMGLLIRDPAPKSLQSASVAHVEVPPGVAHPRARSTRSDKLYICIDGSLEFVIDGERVEIEPVDLLVIEKGEWFEYRNTGARAAAALLVHIPPFDLSNEVFESRHVS